MNDDLLQHIMARLGGGTPAPKRGLRGQLAKGPVDAFPQAGESGDEDLLDYILNRYPHAPRHFSPMEQGELDDVRLRNKFSVFPAREDVDAQWYADRWDPLASPRLKSKQDSVYAARRMNEARMSEEAARRRRR